MGGMRLTTRISAAYKGTEAQVIPVSEIMAKLPPEERRKVEELGQQLLAEEMTYRDLRKAYSKTQAHIAKKLRIKLEGVSRIEKRADLLLATLTEYVEAMGGTLRLVAESPDRLPVMVTGFGDLNGGDVGSIQ